MVCKSPIIVRNPHYVDDLMLYGSADKWVRVPCGRCSACRVQRTRVWAERIMSESFYHENNVFVTLTYDDDHVPRLPNGQLTLVKKDLQDFWKRLRRDLEYYEEGRKFRYYACGEYGDQTSRPHYHAICFGLGLDDLHYFEDNWKFGFVKLGGLTYDSARYVAGYVQKKLYGKAASEYGDSQQPFSTMSKGIGKTFILENHAKFSRGGSVNIGQGRRVRRSTYSDKVLDLSHADKREIAEDLSAEANERWQQRGKESYVYHEFDDFTEVIPKDMDIEFQKRDGRTQFNLDLDRKLSRRRNKL